MSDIITQENNPFFEPEVEKPSAGSNIVNFLQFIVILAFIGIAIYTFVATPNQVSGRSMLPNFLDNDLLLTNRMAQWFDGTPLGSALGLNYNRGDVIVLTTPELPDEAYIIKRIIGLPGDTIGVRDGSVFLNGELLNESRYLPPERRTESGNFLQEGDTLTVPAGQYAILGDNRPESLDSRNLPIGFIDKSQIVGRVILRFWQQNNLQFQFIGNSQDTSSELSRSV